MPAAPIETNHGAGCSREKSRAAQKRIKQDILDTMVELKPGLPEDCPLRPEQDLFKWQEAHKSKVRGNFKCGFCGKTFKNEFYLDRHLDNKHQSEFLANATLCLSDYCDVLDCDDLIPGRPIPICREEEMQRRHHRCRGVFDRCFPSAPHDRESQHLHDTFTHQFCDKLSCSGRSWRSKAWHPDGPSRQDRSQVKIGSGRAVVLTLLFVFLVVFYGVMVHARRESATRRDLRPLTSRQRGLPALLARIASLPGVLMQRAGVGTRSHRD
mmetsp:Transcript_64924/g.146465  ORF Transcript_64924/g.146465 Transcript_64924/m.146465 type:complete len:268 (-) Transcript_64924:183-986(-)|eukprot:CAMPEP_0172623648 /NCGR_PEP_ID=MMETSP1068-20121228/130658_1 /TAXON_ID=35684 /ORGANISM="Pseudopedinella elastica, Strain CCMP716" /LENGTH=267 /DNA_ID=CAMNT_0013432299 /DNA_START=258 /DNA_END=1061 /DNA_ORIENTATION=+